MRGATFLLVVNATIGLSFALAFRTVAAGPHRRMAYLSSAGFLAAAAVVTVEMMAPLVPTPRASSALSFGFLMLALTLIVSDLAGYYRPAVQQRWLWVICGSSAILHPLVIFDLPRDSLEHAVAYQLPFAVMSGIGAHLLVWKRTATAVEAALACVLGLSSIQFLGKALLANAITTGPSVSGYILSTYAHFSQTASAVLSLLLGISLLGVLVWEHIAHRVRAAQMDRLSGTMNRALFYQEAERLLASSSTPSCLILCDLDHFKRVNDRFGHAAGDEVISMLGRTICYLAEDAGICGRIGGEEFAILIRDCGSDGGRIFVQGAMSVLSGASYTLLPVGEAVTASFGIAEIARGEILSSAMQRADAALYAAKHAGRNCVRIARAAVVPERKTPSARASAPA